MAKDHSFDVVSKVDLQEARNAMQMAQREIGTRFDFRNSSAGVMFEGTPAVLVASGDHAAQLNSVVQLVQEKLAKRGVSPRALAWREPEQLPNGRMKRQAQLQQGLSAEQARAVVKTIKGMGLKVQPRIDGEAVRVSGRQLDDLQAVIKVLKAQDFGLPIQVENYR